jgi:flavin reductase (DIM6/NTAB) family NADH-FMN oxidoreductase RutF
MMDPKAKKQTMRLLTYGLHVLTAQDGDDVAAATVSWLSQASFEPPLIMVGIKVDSGIHEVVKQTGVFAVNTLGEGQKDIAAAFFRPSQVEEGRINGYAFEPGPETGAPLLLDLPAWFEARVTDRIERGDHTVVVAEVINAGVRDDDAQPLELRSTGWSYGG